MVLEPVQAFSFQIPEATSREAVSVQSQVTTAVFQLRPFWWHAIYVGGPLMAFSMRRESRPRIHLPANSVWPVRFRCDSSGVHRYIGLPS